MEYRDLSLLLLCLLFGNLILPVRGWSKLFKSVGGRSNFADPIGFGDQTSLILAILAEVVYSFLLIIGWYMRWAIVPLLVNMTVATFVVHGDEPFNTMEKAGFYLGVCVVLLLLDPGIYILDTGYLQGFKMGL